LETEANLGVEARTTIIAGTTMGIQAKSTTGIKAITTRVIVQEGVGVKAGTTMIRGRVAKGGWVYLELPKSDGKVMVK
jgi:hypothetical protein